MCLSSGLIDDQSKSGNYKIKFSILNCHQSMFSKTLEVFKGLLDFILLRAEAFISLTDPTD